MTQAQTALVSAEEVLGFYYVRNPAAGVVGSLPFRVGASVNASNPTPLATVSDNSTMRVCSSMTKKDVLEMIKTSGNMSATIASIPAVEL